MTLRQKVVALVLEMLAGAAWLTMLALAFAFVLVFASLPEQVSYLAWYAIAFAFFWSLLPAAWSWAVWLVSPRYCLEFYTTRELRTLEADVRAVLERRTAVRDDGAAEPGSLDGLVPERAIYRR